MTGASSPCIFGQIARNSTSTTLLHSDDRVVAFQDIKPTAFRHYLVVPVKHIPTVEDLQRRGGDYSLGIETEFSSLYIDQVLETHTSAGCCMVTSEVSYAE